VVNYHDRCFEQSPYEAIFKHASNHVSKLAASRVKAGFQPDATHATQPRSLHII